MKQPEDTFTSDMWTLPCEFCGTEFDHWVLGPFGCPNLACPAASEILVTAKGA